MASRATYGVTTALSSSQRSSRNGVLPTILDCYIRNLDVRHRTVIERFNGSYRRAVLDAYIFRTIDEVRMQTEAWRNYYNNERPHESLNNMTPYEYRALKEKDDD